MTALPNLPQPTLERLPLYYRCLLSWQEKGWEYISSEELGRELQLDAAQVRKDLAFFWGLGRPGVGHNVAGLLESLRRLLGLDRPNHAVLAGVGRLGAALASYPGFARYGIQIISLFDADPEKWGTVCGGLPVRPLGELTACVRDKAARLGIIAVPAAAAQRVAQTMTEAGIGAIWNFAPVTLQVPPHVFVRNEDLAVGLVTLSYHLMRGSQAE